jgi:hypothetical protein
MFKPPFAGEASRPPYEPAPSDGRPSRQSISMAGITSRKGSATAGPDRAGPAHAAARRSLWAIAGRRALRSTGSGPPLTLTDLRTGTRWRLPWPSRIGLTDQAVSGPDGRLIALDFADPAYQGGGTQVTASGCSTPQRATCAIFPTCQPRSISSSTSVAWASQGCLVMLAGGPGRDRNIVAIWKRGAQVLPGGAW